MATMPDSLSHLEGVRINDLIAKIARVTLKDTTRVMLATQLVSEFLDTNTGSMLEEWTCTVTKPSARESVLCNAAYDELLAALKRYGDSFAVDTIRALD